MYFQQFYLGCLAHASYLIGSGKDGAVVDPRRDVDIYLEEAERVGLQIRHVIETHLHADFVSGHRELAERTGAQIYFGWRTGANFEHVAVREGDEIRLGEVVLRFLETPGHTPESISVVVIDTAESTEPEAVLTGDTLFIGDVGRPDLLGARMSAQDLAGELYDSLHGKLLRLPDEVKVYPAHGAGSLCGRNISNEKSSTIGQERNFNYALKEMPREEFVRLVTTDLPEAPEYFSRDAEINRAGAPALDDLPPPKELVPQEVERLALTDHVVVDIRSSSQFGTGHIAASLNIGLGGQFASWAGTLLSSEDPIVLVAEDVGQVQEATVRLARVGLERVVGFLSGGILGWDEARLPLNQIDQINVDELHHRIQQPNPPRVLDVRRPAEWEAGHIAGSIHVPLNRLGNRLKQPPEAQPDKEISALMEGSVAVVCAGGYRSSMATSLLARAGHASVLNVVGGMTA